LFFDILISDNWPNWQNRLTGSTTYTYDYDAFGNVISATGELANPYQFVGGYGCADDGVGLIYMRARYYMPEIGRFTSRDPWWGRAKAPLSLNRYLYTGNNPATYVDPEGLITMRDKCPLWEKALTYARQQANSCCVKAEFEKLGANLENLLKSNTPPDAYVQEKWRFWWWHAGGAHNPKTGNITISRWACYPGWFHDHTDLARIIVHELAERAVYRHTGRANHFEAERISNTCFK